MVLFYRGGDRTVFVTDGFGYRCFLPKARFWGACWLVLCWFDAKIRIVFYIMYSIIKKLSTDVFIR